MFVADLHIHSKYSRATSPQLDLEHLHVWAQKKGLDVVGTGDVTHPAWLCELSEKLVPDGSGLFTLGGKIAGALDDRVPPACRRPVKFVLQCEISSIYKYADRVRKVHNVFLFPDIPSVETFNRNLAKLGNLHSDGRPILGVDSRDVLEIALGACPDVLCIPAHIWTPWFSVLGSKSGFDSLDDCYRDLLPHVHAVETGLSSDPPMNWRVSSLDRFFLVSSSDAHSPDKLGREATIFDCPPSYWAILREMRAGNGPAGTIEFFPEEGKYHVDGHRKCNVRLLPEETRKLNGLCPACGKPVTVGVLNRVEELADRTAGVRGKRHRNYYSLVGLDQVIAESQGTSGRDGKAVLKTYEHMLATYGPELTILLDVPLADLSPMGARVREGIERVRSGRIHLDPGYDGEFGTVRVFGDGGRVFGDGGHGQGNKRASLLGQGSPLPPGEGGRRPGEGQTTSASLLGQGSPLPPGEGGRRPGEGLAASASLLGQGSPLPPGEGGRRPGEGLAGSALSPDQVAVVEAPSGPAVVIAGPGSGKTRTLVHRVAHLLDGGAAPESIVVLTFTRKAAAEIRTRLADLVGEETASGVFAGTFHSFSLALLRTPHGPRCPVRPAVCSRGDRALLTERASRETGEAPGTPRCDAAYVKLLRRHGLVELDELVPMACALRMTDADKEADPGQGHRPAPRPGAVEHVLVDEFQDIDAGQYRLVELLAERVTDVMVVGDPGQSIYGFRGGSPEYFERFASRFSARRFALVANHRSTPGIQAVSGMLLGLRPWDESLGKHAVEISLAESPTDKAEAELVAHTIEQLVGGTASFSFNTDRVESWSHAGFSFRDIAVLTRTAWGADAICVALARLGVPVARHAKPSREFEDAVDLLEAAARYAAESGDDLARMRLEAWGAHRRKEDPQISVPRMLAEIREIGSSPVDVARMLEAVAGSSISEETAGLLKLGVRGRAESWSDLAFLLSTLSEPEMSGTQAERVSVMTMHAAKGLEFEVVIICGLEEGILPYTVSGTPGDEEEERRLLYVGMTRPKRLLFLSWAKTRTVFGKREEQRPSRFLAEIEARLSKVRRAPGPAKTKKANPLPKPVQKRLL